MQRGHEGVKLRPVAGPDCGRSPDLVRVREMLFPDLPAEQAWRLIDDAFAGASDPERWSAVEAEARRQQLDETLVMQLREAVRERRGNSDERA
jgi:hypothetical protein